MYTFLCYTLSWSIFLFTTVPICTTTGSLYKLLVPPLYVAFTGDLIVNYSIPNNVSIPNAFIRVLAIIPSGKQEITTLSLHTGYSTGSGKVRCGLIEHAGRHLLEMHEYADGPILTTKSFTVQWPKVRLNLPLSHFAQTSAVNLEYVSEAICKPVLHRYYFQIDLEFSKGIQEGPNFHYEKPTKLNTVPVEDISKSIGSIHYECGLFDVKGSYRAVLRNSFNFENDIARSNKMKVRWSTNYGVKFHKKSIFPCSGYLTVLYTHPQCPSANDKIRMYRLLRHVAGSPAAPLERVYVAEKHADPDKTMVNFDCRELRQTAVGFCFVYVSISNSDVITEQYKVCKPAHENSVLPIDGGWNEWSKWASCSVTCGTGKKSRFRYCNNPTPTDGGRFCEGAPIEWQPCFTYCPDSIPLNPLHSPNVHNKCACGCSLNGTTGEIIGTGRCEGLSLWIIKVKEKQRIRLAFQYFDLYEKYQWLKIRNGDTTKSDLLAISFGDNILTEVVTSKNTMLIEFMTHSNTSSSRLSSSFSSSSFKQESSTLEYPSLPTRKIHVHGFIASYTAYEANETALLAVIPSRQEAEEGSIWESTVTIVGISLCGVIVLVLVTVAVHHKCIRKRQHKYAMATQQESPSHVPKSGSMHSTPSHHSALSGIEIDYDMERPLTGQNNKKHSISVHMSRNSSVSSNRSNGHNSNKKRFKTKAEITPGGSPKPPTKHYSPLPSPQVKEVKEAGADDKTSLFNTSPLLGRKPRSPKVHPSSKFKLKEGAKTPSSPKETKHDLLVRKRFNNGTKGKEPKQIHTPSEKTSDKDKSKPLAATPLSTGSLTPTGKVVCVEINQTDAERARKRSTTTPGAEEDKSLKTPKAGNIPLSFIDKTEPEESRKPGSGTSDDSQSPDKLNTENYQTTSFVEQPDQQHGGKTKPRRPTSLTESYSFNKLPSVVTENSASDDKTAAIAAKLDRHNDLPKPDGQSPKTPREGRSKGSTPKSVRSSRSRLTLSPSHSVTTPSDNLEMEYDDFIDYDDTYSYFDPIETEKLQWKGAERLGKHAIQEEDSNDHE